MKSRLACGIAVFVAIAGLRIDHLLSADEVVLVPGTIAGIATVGNLPVSFISVTASPQAGGAASSAGFSPSPAVVNAPYSMTVSLPQAGTSTYNVSGSVRTDSNRDIIFFQSVPTSVSAATPGQRDFVVASPGFIQPVFTVLGSVTITQLSMTAFFSGPGVSEQASTNAPATTNFIFPAVPRNGVTVFGTVTFSNGVQVQLPSRTIDVAAGQTTQVPFTVDGSATGSIGGSVSFSGPLPVQRTEITANGPTSRTLVQQPPPGDGVYSVGPLTPGTYSLMARARFNNFDDIFTFPTPAYTPARSGLAVGTSETVVNVAAEQAFINGAVQLTGASSLQPFVNGGFVFASGASASTSGGTSQDNLVGAASAYDLIVSPGAWRLQQATVNFFRPAPFLSGSFSYFDNRAAAIVNATPEEPTILDIPIALGEITITMSVSGGGTLSNPSVSGSCVQRDDSNVVLWSSSFNFSTSGQNNVATGSVTFASPSGTCTVTPRAVVNGQTVVLPLITGMQVIAGSSQTVDVGGPSLTITSHAPEAVVGTSSIFISGKASDDVAVASVMVNGIATSLSSAGNPSDPPQVNFTTASPILLQRGPNLITTVAKDTASPQNSTTDTRTIYWDTALPSLSFSPANGSTTFANSVAVAGTASDDAGVKRITVNGIEVAFSSSGNPAVPTQVSFSTSIPLVVGANPITVVVTDISNRTTMRTQTITRQQQATTTLSVANVSVPFGGSATLSATLLSQGLPVAGKSLLFTLNGASASGTTNASGVASVSGLSVTGFNVASYPGAISVAFAGDADFLASNATGELTVTKAAAVVTLGNLSQTYNGGPLSPTASTSPSGLAVVWTGAPQTNAGSYAVTATVDDSNYEGAASGTFVIQKANATISILGFSGVFNGEPHGATGTATGVLHEPLTGLNLGATFTNVPGGTANWTFTDVTGNYNNASGSVPIAIAKANALISVSGFSGPYDGLPHGATGTAKGVKGETLVGLNYGATFTNVPGGTASWTFTDVTGNYNNASGTAAVTITKAPLTIKANDKQKIEGGLNPVLDGVIVGNNYDNISASFATTAVVMSPPANYPIVPAAVDTVPSKIGNYEIALVPGTLVVTPNAAPVIQTVTANVDPVQITNAVTVSASFTDVDVIESAPYTAIINWGDGQTTTSTGSTEPVAVTAPAGGNDGTISGSHKYSAPGVYTITVTVSDKIPGTNSKVYQYVVVYDPNGGFVTGGGFVESAAGAYVLDPTLTGKASFGFVAKYLRGVTSGQTQFQFKAGDLNFHSSAYDWLTVASFKAIYKGTGTINGAGEYGFLLSAIDGQIAGGGGVDKFRIKIWDKATEVVVYDNQIGASDESDSADPITALTGGSISIKAR